MTLSFASSSDPSLPLFVLERSELAGWMVDLPDHVQVWVEASGFAAALEQVLLIPGSDGTPKFAPTGYGSAAKRSRKRFPLAAAAEALPAGIYHIASGVSAEVLEAEYFGWSMIGYAFDRYAPNTPANVKQIAPDGIDAARVETLANTELLIRHLANTWASDLEPEQMQVAAETLPEDCGANCFNITGNALLNREFLTIHAVEPAAAQAPRSIEKNWCENGPKLTLAGNGVCLDISKLNLKLDASTRLMKKTMDGAANFLGLAQTIMKPGLNVRSRAIIPAAENTLVGSAFCSVDILTARNRQTMKIGNSDAEDRLVQADTPALAHEGHPGLAISMATLTSLARAADGMELAPQNTDDDGTAEALMRTGRSSTDLIWRMSFYGSYEAMVEPGGADLDNAPSGGLADSIPVAFFPRRFVGNCPHMQFDIYSWQCSKNSGRTKGGLGQEPHALQAALPKIRDL